MYPQQRKFYRNALAGGDMRIAVSGSSGLIGAALVARLRSKGHTVLRLVRVDSTTDSSLNDESIGWDPENGLVQEEALSGVEGVVHLAGENLVSARWTKQKMRRIRDSRTVGTAALSNAITAMDTPPGVFVSASAVGYYGNRGSELLTEESTLGSGFLADVCAAWEAAALPATNNGVRVVHPRLGMVLSKHGGALSKMLPLFRMGLGGKLGPGSQYMPWIGLHDSVSALERVLSDANIHGPVNVVAPGIVTNAEVTSELARVLRRPTMLPVPGFALRVAMGRIAEETLLSSQRVAPAVLQRSGFVFQHPTLREELADLLQGQHR
jgi:uncharacterized protein